MKKYNVNEKSDNSKIWGKKVHKNSALECTNR